MAAANQFSLTHYVGALLAHGGVLSIEADRLIFVPGAVEKAIGASNTEIPFNKIKMVEVAGTITESLIVRTAEKAHRFVGGDPHKIREKIEQAIGAYVPGATAAAPASPTPATAAAHAGSPAPAASAAPSSKAPAHVCAACGQPSKSEFHYCPFCRAVQKLSCPQCYRTIDNGWKFCAFCGVQFQYQ